MPFLSSQPIHQTKAFQTLIQLIDVHRPVFEILLFHGSLVAAKALKGAKKVSQWDLNLSLIYEGSLLHDIGIIHTQAPSIDCHGDSSYIEHGVLGAEMLRKLGFIKEARICECHVGVCLSKKEIV